MGATHLSNSWAATGNGVALAAFIVSAFFFVDVFGEYFVNISHFFSLDRWIEAIVAIVRGPNRRNTCRTSVSHQAHEWQKSKTGADLSHP